MLGGNLRNLIDDAFTQNGVTLAVVKDFVLQTHTELSYFYDKVKNLITGFEGLGIGFEQLEPLTAELGVLIPKRKNKDNLEYFAKDVASLNRELKVFDELVNGKVSNFRINSISSSDFSVFIDMLPATIQTVTSVIHQIMLAYEKLLGIRKNLEDLRKNKAPKKVVDSMEDWAKDIMEKEIESITADLLGQFKGVKREEGRDNEIKVAVKLNVRKLAGRIDVGYNFSARIGPPPEIQDEENPTAKEEEQKQLIQSIENTASEIGYKKLGGDPVLPLIWRPNEDNDGNEDNEEQAKTK